MPTSGRRTSSVYSFGYSSLAENIYACPEFILGRAGGTHLMLSIDLYRWLLVACAEFSLYVR